MLRQVQSDRSNLAHGWLPFAADSITAVWHSDAARGPSTPSLDHLVGALLKQRRHVKPERLGGLEVDDQLELDRGLHWKLARFCALEDAIDIRRRASKIIDQVISVGQQAADSSKLTVRIE